MTIIPVINKIDLPAADPDRVAEEIEVGSSAIDATDDADLGQSAKNGIGIRGRFWTSVVRNDAAAGRRSGYAAEAPLLFDSHGTTAIWAWSSYIRVIEWQCRGKGEKITFSRDRQGVCGRPRSVCFTSGDRSRLTAIRPRRDRGIMHARRSSRSRRLPRRRYRSRLPGRAACRGATATRLTSQSKPMVFCGLYPIDSQRSSPNLREALVADAASTTPRCHVRGGDHRRHSGFGFRCGFLGLLHMEIVQERLDARVQSGTAWHDGTVRRLQRCC